MAKKKKKKNLRLKSGSFFSKKSLAIFAVSFAVIGGAALYVSFAAGLGDGQISATFKASPIVIKTSAQYAGAINSLSWGGKQFVESVGGGGRLLQSAISFNDFGGCLNPTEAGSTTDTTTSSSKVINYNASGNTLTTKTQAAYWLPPGYKTPHLYCGQINRSSQPLGVAQNTTVLSNTYINKKVTIGYEGIPNAIEYTTWFDITQNYNSVLFEDLTAYVPGDVTGMPGFTSFWAYNPASKSLSTLSNGAGYAVKYDGSCDWQCYDVVRDQLQDYPVIFSTADKNYAIGVYSPDIVNRFTGPTYGSWQYGIRPLGYGRWNFDFYAPTLKWNTMYRGGYTPPGTYGFRHFVAVGSLSDVTSAIDQLYVKAPKSVSRADGAVKIVQSFTLSAPLPSVPTFADVSSTNSAYSAIEVFNFNKITNGCATSPKIFCPDRLMTRAETDTFLLRAAKNSIDPNDTTPVFADVPASHPLFAYVQKFYRLGLTSGCATNPLRFCPDEPVRVQDLQTFIDRVKSLPK